MYLFGGDAVIVVVEPFAAEEEGEPGIVSLLGLGHGLEAGAIPRHKLRQLLDDVLQFRVIRRLWDRHHAVRLDTKSTDAGEIGEGKNQRGNHKYNVVCDLQSGT